MKKLHLGQNELPCIASEGSRAAGLPRSRDPAVCHQMLGTKGNKQICLLENKPLLFGVGPWDLASGSLFY